MIPGQSLQLGAGEAGEAGEAGPVFCGPDGVRAIRVDRIGRASAEDRTFEQRVRGQAVRAVDPGAGDLAHGEEARDGRSSLEIGAHPAHEVVSGRGDRNEVSGQIETMSGEAGGDAREPGGRLGDGPGIEDAGPTVLSGRPSVQGEGDDITGGELGPLVDLRHEPAGLLVEEEGTGAADGFGDEEPGTGQSGGMELEELEVTGLGAGTEGCGQAVTGRRIRVRRVGEELPGTAGGEYDGIGAQSFETSVPKHGDSGGADGAALALAGRGDVDEHGVFEQAEPPGGRLGAGGGRERGGDLTAGGVPAGVEDAGEGMGAFHAARPGSGLVPVELDTGGRESEQRIGTGGAQHLDGLVDAVPGTGGERIGHMGGDGVIGADDPGDPALRPRGVRLTEAALRDHGDLVAAGQTQGAGETGDPGAGDDDAAHQIRGFAASIRSRDTRAGSATSASTEIWLTTRPAMSDSSTQAM